MDADVDAVADDVDADGPGALAPVLAPHALSPCMIAFRYYEPAAFAAGASPQATYGTSLVARRKLQAELRTDPIAVVYRKVRTLPLCAVDSAAHMPDEVLCSPRLFNR